MLEYDKNNYYCKKRVILKYKHKDLLFFFLGNVLIINKQLLLNTNLLLLIKLCQSCILEYH